jgi:hypothetical protein
VWAHCMVSTLSRFEPFGFLPVGTPKTLAYAVPVDNEEVLQHCIVNTCQTIRNYSDIFERMWQSMSRHVKAFTESHGHLSTYYKSTISVTTHKLNVSGNMLIWTFFLVMVYETHAQSLSTPSVTPCILAATLHVWKLSPPSATGGQAVRWL